MSVPASLPDDAMTVAVNAPAEGRGAVTPPVAVLPGDGGFAWSIARGQRPSGQPGSQDFSSRVRELIERAGGVAGLAQCCGVSERTVRNWRDGRSDISRERCLVLARALGISPLWLVSGEGSMTNATGEALPSPADAASRRSAVDSERLAAALQVLQSYIVLAGGSLNLMQRAEAVAELYSMLAQPGLGDARRLIAFHNTLGAHLRSNRLRMIT